MARSHPTVTGAGTFPDLDLASAVRGRNVIGIARAGIFLVLWLIISGAMMYAQRVSSLLLNGTYALLAGCILLCLFYHWPMSRAFRGIIPYLGFVAAYFVWGSLSAGDMPVTSEAAKIFMKHVLVLGGLAIAIDRHTLPAFAKAAQIALLINTVICFFEVGNPDLVTLIAQTREEGTTAFNPMRPAGLWSNPDEYAFAVAYTILLSCWIRGPIAWIGRAAAVYSIYVAASRTGAAMLLVFATVGAWYWLRKNGMNPARIAALAIALLAGGAAALGVMSTQKIDLSESWQLARMFDFAEKTRDAQDDSRYEIAATAALVAADGGFHGHGLFSYQNNVPHRSVLEIPAHNALLTVWGEAGPVLALAYVMVLAYGFSLVFRLDLDPADRLLLVLMWACYSLILVTWHNEFTSFGGMLFVGLLWHLPRVLARPSQSTA